MPNRLRRYYQNPTSFQYPRRYSYPPTRDAVPAHHHPIILAQNQTKKPYLDAVVYPLTEENLAVHTSCMAAQSEEEKLRNLFLFVQSQRSDIMEQQQQQQQEEIDDDNLIMLARRDSIDLYRNSQEQRYQQYQLHDDKAEMKKLNWLKKLKNWLRTLDHQQQQQQQQQHRRSKSENKTKTKNSRHLSWSAAINFKKDHNSDLLPQQQQQQRQPQKSTLKKRDSSLSSLFFFHQHHSSNNEGCDIQFNQQQEQQQQLLTSIPIARQPKFSLYNSENIDPTFSLNNPNIAKRRIHHATRNSATPPAALLFDETSNSRIHSYVAV